MSVRHFFFFRDLAAKDNGKSDPFATLMYGEKELSTPVLRKTRFPRWNKTYEIPIKRPITDPANRTLRIVLYDYDKFRSNEFLGEVRKTASYLRWGLSAERNERSEWHQK